MTQALLTTVSGFWQTLKGAIESNLDARPRRCGIFLGRKPVWFKKKKKKKHQIHDSLYRRALEEEYDLQYIQLSSSYRP